MGRAAAYLRASGLSQVNGDGLQLVLMEQVRRLAIGPPKEAEE